ncbi:hypothetical protein BDW22DRAFT_1327192, partial [Trametopsis cervina]
TNVPFGVTYEKIGTIQRRLAWPLHKDDTLSRSGRPTGLNIYCPPELRYILRTRFIATCNFILRDCELYNIDNTCIHYLNVPLIHIPALMVLTGPTTNKDIINRYVLSVQL